MKQSRSHPGAGKILRRASTIILCLVLAGCAGSAVTRPLSEPRTETTEQSELVATDLVSVLMQLKELSPFSTTVQLSRAKTDFGNAVSAALDIGGYGVQQVDYDQGLHYVAYRNTSSETDAGKILSYEISIADISVRRDFTQIDGQVFPASAVFVTGAAVQRVVVNDDLYRQRGGNTVFPNGLVFLDHNGETLEARQRDVRVTNAMARDANERINHERMLVLARANLFSNDRMFSNSDRFENTRLTPVKQVILRFANNTTLDLGASNKRAIKAMHAAFNPRTDRFAITGCSHGRSLIWDGSESMALQRSMRVREELLIAGVALEQMKEESCFATTYGNKLPKRSVILTIERLPV